MLDQVFGILTSLFFVSSFDRSAPHQVPIMNKICKQLSIESPSRIGQKEHVFQYDVMIPDVPPQGARLKVSFSDPCSCVPC